MGEAGVDVSNDEVVEWELSTEAADETSSVSPQRPEAMSNEAKPRKGTKVMRIIIIEKDVRVTTCQWRQRIE
jgi:hypothetical protein